eukprot:6740959-Prymnesium_polylepis.6
MTRSARAGGCLHGGVTALSGGCSDRGQQRGGAPHHAADLQTLPGFARSSQGSVRIDLLRWRALRSEKEVLAPCDEPRLDCTAEPDDERFDCIDVGSPEMTVSSRPDPTCLRRTVPSHECGDPSSGSAFSTSHSTSEPVASLARSGVTYANPCLSWLVSHPTKPSASLWTSRTACGREQHQAAGEEMQYYARAHAHVQHAQHHIIVSVSVPLRDPLAAAAGWCKPSRGLHVLSPARRGGAGAGGRASGTAPASAATRRSKRSPRGVCLAARRCQRAGACPLPGGPAGPGHWRARGRPRSAPSATASHAPTRDPSLRAPPGSAGCPHSAQLPVGRPTGACLRWRAATG